MALVNQPLLVRVLVNVVGFDALRRLRAMIAPGAKAARSGAIALIPGWLPQSIPETMLHSADFCNEIRTFTD